MSFTSETTIPCHIVAIPYPGRGHINPMMNLCEFLVSKSDNILITFVVTGEWLGFIGSEPRHDKIRFLSIPNVLPSELVRGSNMFGFMEAVWTKMDVPFECLLDQLKPRATIIMADTLLFWAISIGNRRNIPVASFWPMSPMMFSVFHHFHLLQENGHFPIDLSEKGDEQVDYIPGVSATRLTDLSFPGGGSPSYILNQLLNSISSVRKAKYLLFPSIYELESKSIDILKAEFPFPVYPIGPAIPYFQLGNSPSSRLKDSELMNCLQWLDRQPKNSVLYVSLGSFAPVSSTQMDEISAGLNDSGVGFFWVVRDETCRSRMKEACSDKGLVVPWCDQLRLLMHPSIGGFWSHCGWNSVQEGIFAGIPLLTFPLVADQKLNSKLVVEDWKIGWRVKKWTPAENLVARGDISELVEKFMDLKRTEVKEMWERVQDLKEKFLHAIDKNGSSDTNISSFISNIS
ncbi:hypothetical protein PTKIN_Ptkin11bG0004100 [Pterospermum kingtungense]